MINEKFNKVINDQNRAFMLQYGKFCISGLTGGTASSAILRTAIAFRPTKMGDRELKKLILFHARKCLDKHNKQDKPFFTYDLNTGLPIEKKLEA